MVCNHGMGMTCRQHPGSVRRRRAKCWECAPSACKVLGACAAGVQVGVVWPALGARTSTAQADVVWPALGACAVDVQSAGSARRWRASRCRVACTGSVRLRRTSPPRYQAHPALYQATPPAFHELRQGFNLPTL